MSKQIIESKASMWLSGVTTAHHLLLACVLLPIDFTKSNDPTLWIYHRVRWKLYTSWVNIMILGYYSVTFYCNWRELQGEESRRDVRILTRLRHLCFPGVFAATVMFITAAAHSELSERD